MIHDLLLLSASYFLVMLFAAAALHKLLDSAAFVRVVADYRVMPAVFAGPVAMLVIVAELAIAVALMTEGLHLPGAVAAAALLLVYGAGMAINLARGRRSIDCGCALGRSAGGLSHGLVLRNMALTGLAIALAVAGPVSSASVILHLNAMLGAVALWVIYATLDLLGGNAVRSWVRESQHD